MVEFGPVQIVVMGFPNLDKLRGGMLKEIFRLSDKKIIRVVGLSAIVKDEKGNIETAQITELSDRDRIKMGAAIGALIGYGAAGMKGAEAGAEAGARASAERVSQEEFGLSREEIMEIAQNIPNGTAAGLLLIEHLWAKKLEEIVLNNDGTLLAQDFIEPAVIVALGAELAEGAETAEKIETQKKPGAVRSEAEAAAGE